MEPSANIMENDFVGAGGGGGGGAGFIMENEFDAANAMFDVDVFDKIEDFMDFNAVDMEFQPLGFDDDGAAAPAALPPPSSDFPTDSKPCVGGGGGGADGHSRPEDGNAFQCDDIDVVELEWLSNFMDECFSPQAVEIPMTTDADAGDRMEDITDANKVAVDLQYRSASPNSVLEHNAHPKIIVGGGGVVAGGGGGCSFSSSSLSSPTSSSCSSVGTQIKVPTTSLCHPPNAPLIRGRAPRTKRPRPPHQLFRSLVPFQTPPEEAIATGTGDPLPTAAITPLEHFAESNPIMDEDEEILDKKPKKQSKLKIVSSEAARMDKEALEEESPPPPPPPPLPPQGTVRKCMHCEIQKTPQWRAGPMGPKTLCNACGVRYKSGRLFPEYRPAASPTFLPSQHSNSHKKVVEMRVKSTNQKSGTAVVPSSLPVSTKGCELLNYIKSS